MKKISTLLVSSIALFALSSCGSDGKLTQDLGSVIGDFQILDLTTGTVESKVAVADLLTNSTYLTTKIVFRAVPNGSGVIGTSAGAFGAQSDEVSQSVTLSRCYMAVFEITRDQWTNLAGTTPWTAFSSSLAGLASGSKPACGVSRDAVNAVLVTWNSSHSATLALPTENQWEYACRGGTSTTFSWGEDRSDSVVSLYANVSETAGGTAGPKVVGQRTANAFGFFDMHGNVWEFTVTDSIRGGSWRDSLPMSRSANRKSLDQAVGHPLVGVRLVLGL